jgi:S1-C subfamily serine protease
MARTACALALVFAVAGAGARAAVVVPTDALAGFKSVADRLHTTVISVRARAAISVPAGEAPQEVVQTPSLGTGVLVGDGLAVTTLHTVGGLSPGKMTAWADIEVVLQDSPPMSAKIVGWFPDLDLAVLRLAESPAVEALELAPEVPRVGEPLLAMGADDEAISVVGVSLAATSGDQLLLTSNRRVDSRYWGGPVFDIKGRLVGITLPSVTTTAISSMAIGALLDRVRKQ